MITWDGSGAPRELWPADAQKWYARALHGDTNTDEMFLFTTIMCATPRIPAQRSRHDLAAT